MSITICANSDFPGRPTDAITGLVRPIEGIHESSLSRDLRFLITMQKTTRYANWIVQLAAPYLGDTVLEVAPGIGIITERIYRRRRLTCLEMDKTAAKIMRTRFSDLPAVSVLEGNVEREDWLSSAGPAGYDCVVCVNVLEHVSDDLAGLRNMPAALRPGGHLFFFAPALMAISGASTGQSAMNVATP